MAARRIIAALTLAGGLAACARDPTYSDLGDCRFKANGQTPRIEACMASKGYRLDFSLKGCAPDPANPHVTPNPLGGPARSLFHPDPEDERCYAKGP